MQPNIANGAEFMKRIIKASLSALFAIGVTSSKNVDKFISHFSEELLKNYSQPQNENSKPNEPAKIAPQSPTTNDNMKSDINVLIENTIVQKALYAAGITTIESLVFRMQQEDLVKIKGIGRKSADELRAAVNKWIQPKLQ